MKTKIKPIRAYAVVKRDDPKLKVLDIYDTKDVKEIKVSPSEKIVQIVITVV